ncbi:putative DNA-binding WGR domain protein [Bacillus ectoiniformans]|uniref:hypothetical protein n=1 Tax=Bacillus ectoiniformans TaxID=1494429 RepID=UPI00195E0905|nr:hypothetical protein [Bacillus ectoiniformans]MBM7648655.1 putative DNA-binding WGR domain protein [Bacillus ectoiniformans]
MIKLIKQEGDETLYWEVWNEGKMLTIHSGVVGDTGEAEERKLSFSQFPSKVMSQLAQEKVDKEGYDYVDEEELIELVVQFSYEENETNKMLKKRHDVEDLMNECLGWTGNGHCDGGDIGSGTANIYNYVIDPEKAAESILGELANHDLLSDVKIAFEDPEEEEYIVLYPKGAEFDIL